MEFMKDVPDKFYELAVVDPPYGIGYSEIVSSKQEKYGWKKREYKSWDINIPNREYFDELFRVTKNQIIWGGNYFELKPTRCFLIWDKVQRINQADCELAWTSFNSSARIFYYARGNESGFAPKSTAIDKQFANIHPTQKPVKLYEWLLMNYAKEGDKILDTHGGSQSSRIACYNLGYALDIIELDKEYFDQGNKRFEQHKQQLTLF